MKTENLSLTLNNSFTENLPFEKNYVFTKNTVYKNGHFQLEMSQNMRLGKNKQLI